MTRRPWVRPPHAVHGPPEAAPRAALRILYAAARVTPLSERWSSVKMGSGCSRPAGRCVVSLLRWQRRQLCRYSMTSLVNAGH
jgi:hypothetical protein